jgi:MGT family glycosyltransferase
VPWDGDAALVHHEAPPIPGPTDRPLVLVTLGTVYNFESEILRRFLQALGGEDVDVLCAVGVGADLAELGDVPANVQIETYVPFSKVLPRCAALLCHGGFNTVMSAVVAGVPVVCVPLGSDQDFNARVCQKEGFGLSIDPEDATVDRLRQAIRRILDERRFTNKIRAFRREMAAAPSPDEVVLRIEEQVAGRDERSAPPPPRQ